MDKEDIQDMEIALNEDTIVQVKSHKSYIQVTLFIPVYLPQIQTIYQLAPLPYQMDAKTQLYTEKLLPPSFTMKPETHEIQGPKSSCALAVAKLESLEGKCPITFTRYQEIHKLITMDTFDIYLIKAIGTMIITCPYMVNQWIHFSQTINIMIIHTSCAAETIGSQYHFRILARNQEFSYTNTGARLLIAYDISSNSWIPDDHIRWIIIIVLISITGLLVILIIGCIIHMNKLKYWISQVTSLTNLTYGQNTEAGYFPMLANLKQTIQNSPIFQKKTQNHQNQETTEEEEEFHRNSYRAFQPHIYDLNPPTISLEQDDQYASAMISGPIETQAQIHDHPEHGNTTRNWANNDTYATIQRKTKTKVPHVYISNNMSKDDTPYDADVEMPMSTLSRKQKPLP